MATRTSAPRAFTVPRGPDQLLDMSAMGARKRGRRRKSKHSFGSTSSCSSNLPSNTQADLPELFARLTLRHAANEDDRRRRDAAGDGPLTSKGCSKGELPKTPKTAPSDSRKERSSLRATKPSRKKECQANASEGVDNGTVFTREVKDIANGKPGPKSIAESDVVDIVRQMREVLQERGPSQEEELLEALGQSQAKPVLEAYGSLIAFLDRFPDFRVVHEDLYTFVYYLDPEDEDEDTASTGSRPLSSSKEDDGYQCTSAGKGRPRRSRASSTSSGSSYATAVEGWEDDRDWRNLYATKSIWGQLPRSPRHRSRARREVMRTCDAEAQTPGWGLARIAELELMLRKRDAKIAELRERLKLLRACHAREVRLLRAKIEKILKKPPPAPPRSATRARSNRSAAKSRASEGARAQDLPQQPRRVLRQRSPPPRLRREEKPSTRPIVPTPRPVTLMDKECSWSAQWPPVPEFYELPGRNKNNTTVPHDQLLLLVPQRQLHSPQPWYVLQTAPFTNSTNGGQCELLIVANGGSSQELCAEPGRRPVIEEKAVV
ncbi:hypothetical protein HPB50_006948 [Hyalomma asiaticum]|uniref:Uncharacterized protein n=1 Tax=Hyalomma asiaticum TaxID=266040 RepID=A0ACB7T621_HYAAI|nr:hypothetical protein HPB50_006948 [Hyalomma asiaticum]